MIQTIKRLATVLLSAGLVVFCASPFAGESSLEKAILAQATQPDARCLPCKNSCDAANARCQPSCESTNFSCHTECGGSKICRQSCNKAYQGCIGTCETKRDSCEANCPCATAIPGSRR